jgi:hypothetical protein
MLGRKRRWVLLFLILLLASIAGWAVWGWRLGHEYDRRIAALAAAGYPTVPESLEDDFRDPSNGWPLLVEAAEARSGMRMVRNFFDLSESSLIERVNDRLDGPIFGLPSASYRYRINRPLLYRYGLRLLSNVERFRSTGPPSRPAEGFDRLFRDQLARVRLASFALDVTENSGLDGVEIPIDPQTGQPFEVERTDTHIVLSSTLRVSEDELLGLALDDGFLWKIKIPR